MAATNISLDKKHFLSFCLQSDIIANFFLF